MKTNLIPVKIREKEIIQTITETIPGISTSLTTDNNHIGH